MRFKKTIVAMLFGALTLTSIFAACGPTSTPDPGNDDDKPGDNPGDATVTELIISTPPTRTEYYVGEVFDSTGMELKAKWSDGIRMTVDIDDCTIEPSGPLSVTDDAVTITYENVSVEQEITVVDTAVESISVDTGNMALKAAVNTPMNFSGIKVTVKYADGNSRVVTNGYTFKVDGEDVEDVSALTFADWGTHTLTVVYGDKTADISIEVFDGFIVEAENIVKEPAETDKNYVQIYKGSSSGSPYGNDSDIASGGAYMGSVFNGSVIRFHVWADEACNANVILRASSGYMLVDGGSWDPIEMGDQQFNRLFQVSYGTAAEAEDNALKELKIGDDVILKGGSTDNPAGDKTLYQNWMDVEFGTLALKEGDNIIELNVITDYINCRNENVACNIDRLEIQYTDDDADETLTAKSIAVKQAPNKTEYLAGESFDPTGMVVEATMSDDSTRTVNLSELEITPSGALTADITEVTITWKGVSTKQAITVTADAEVERIFIEGENLIDEPTVDDKNYVKAIRNGYQGKPGSKASEAPDTAETSGGKYLNGLFGSEDGKSGAVVQFHIWAEEACHAEIKIYASSCNVVTKGTDGSSNWRPSEMGDSQFNQIFAVSFGTEGDLKPVAIGDDVIVEGGKSADGKTDMALWENWREISLGEFDLVAGDNIIQLENINSTLINLAGEIYGMNIDRLCVEIQK